MVNIRDRSRSPRVSSSSTPAFTRSGSPSLSGHDTVSLTMEGKQNAECTVCGEISERHTFSSASTEEEFGLFSSTATPLACRLGSEERRKWSVLRVSETWSEEEFSRSVPPRSLSQYWESSRNLSQHWGSSMETLFALLKKKINLI